MRITVVLGPFYAPPPAPCGAVERIWTDLPAAFAQAGHRVTLVHREHPALGELAVPGVHCVAVRGYDSRGSLARNAPLDLAYSIRALRASPPADILVTNALFLPMLAKAFGRRKGRLHVQVLRTPRGQVPFYSIMGIERYCAPTREIARAVIRKSAAARSRTRVIPLPIRTDFFHPVDGEVHPGDPFVFSYAGRIHPEKGVELLLRAFRKLTRRLAAKQRVRLRIVGPWRIEAGGGGAEFVKSLRKLAHGLPVEFGEPIYDRSEFAAFLRQADAFCYPSLAEQGETFGVAPVEAMSCGCPALLSDLKPFRDYIRHRANGLVFDHKSPQAAENLASAMHQMMSQTPDQYAAMRAHAARTGRRFGTPKVAQAFLQDFRSLIS